MRRRVRRTARPSRLSRRRLSGARRHPLTPALGRETETMGSTASGYTAAASTRLNQQRTTPTVEWGVCVRRLSWRGLWNAITWRRTGHLGIEEAHAVDMSWEINANKCGEAIFWLGKKGMNSLSRYFGERKIYVYYVEMGEPLFPEILSSWWGGHQFEDSS